MNKRINFLITLLMVALSVAAYNDYRNARVDSLEAALKSKNPPKGEGLLRAYDELMRGYLPFDYLKASYYGHKALALSYELNGLRVRQNVLRRFAQMYYAREEYDQALRIFDRALAVVDSMEFDKRYTEADVDDCRSCIYGAIANVYNMQDKAHLAIHYYQLALPIFEKYNWLESQTILYHNIGELYFLMGNMQEAERNYRQALQKSEESKDSLMMALSRKGLLHLYVNQDDYAKALKTAVPCYSFYHAHRTEEVQDYPLVLASMVRLNLMDGHQNIPAAREYAQEALMLADSLLFENRSDVYAAACQLAMAEKQWKQALEYALQTIHPDSQATNGDASCYAMLAEIYTELGQKEQARLYIKKTCDVMNRYATDHYQSGLSQMEVLYETEKKETQIIQLASERRQHLWLLGLAAMLIVVIVALMIYFQLAYRRQKALLAAKVALETETKERRILARDLHDGLGGMLSLLRLKIEGDAEKTEALEILDKTHTELRRTAHHLMPEELLKGGLRQALTDFSISVPGAQFHSFGNNQRLGQAEEIVLYRCAYELVNNAIKHAEATHIDIQLMQEPLQVTLTVSDDGKGMGSEKGMGLQNIRERIAPYHGTLNIVSGEGQGTEINVTLSL
jgi:signal transduction histidine kinase